MITEKLPPDKLEWKSNCISESLLPPQKAKQQQQQQKIATYITSFHSTLFYVPNILAYTCVPAEGAQAQHQTDKGKTL